jgi:hypothetical protein
VSRTPSESWRLERRAARRTAIRRRRAVALLVLLAIVAAVAAMVGLRGADDAGAARAPLPAHPKAVRTATPTAPVRRTALPDTVVKLAAVGDTTFGWDSSRPSDDGVSLLAAARPLLVGDIVLGNLETTLTDKAGGKCGAGSSNCFSFRVPPSFTRGLTSAGFTLMNLANNHANDYGAPGRAQTVAALHAAGLKTTGRPGEIAIVKVKAARVAVLGFAPYPWAQDARKLAAAKRLVRKAAGLADLVVVTGHLGGEGSAYARVRPGTEMFLGENRGNTMAFAHAVVDAGADLVALHGPHVLRALEWYRGRLIAYSLGNFSAYGNFNIDGPGGISAVLQATLRADGRWVEGRLAPVRLVGKGAPTPDPSGAAIATVRSLSRSDMGRRAPRLTSSGAILPPS